MSLALLCGPINLPLSIAHCVKTTRPQQQDFLKVDPKSIIGHQYLRDRRIASNTWDQFGVAQVWFPDSEEKFCTVKNSEMKNDQGTFVWTYL